MRRRRKCLIVSVVFLAAAVCTGYLAYATHAEQHIAIMTYSGGRGWAPSDEEFVAFVRQYVEGPEEAAKQLVPSSSNDAGDPLSRLYKTKAAEARQRLKAKRQKVTAFSVCAIATGVLGGSLSFWRIQVPK